jgi:uncharacterized protein (TIGR02597 family)
MKTRLPLLAFPLLLACSAQAQTVSTDPVGFIPVTAKGSSDTYISFPLHRGAAYQGTLTAATENQGTATLTAGGASFTQNQFNGTHFALIASGTKEGMWYGITATAGSTVTIDLAGDTLGTAVASGTEIQIIPFWTLNTIFPEGAGVKPSPTLLPQTSVLLPDQDRAGTNLAPVASFFYYSGNQFGGEGWRRFGTAPAQKFDDEVLYPDSYLIVRHETAGDTTINIPGAVQMTSVANIISRISSGKAQDNAIAFNVAIPTTLAASQLYESGAFAGSSTIDVPVDQLLVFDNATAQKNKKPSAVYYYFLGDSNAAAGWRLKGNLSTVQNDTLVFQPAAGYIIRKAASGNAQSSSWTVRPSYVPQ